MKLPTHRVSFTHIQHWSDWIAWGILATFGGLMIAAAVLHYMGIN